MGVLTATTLTSAHLWFLRSLTQLRLSKAGGAGLHIVQRAAELYTQDFLAIRRRTKLTKIIMEP